MRVLITGGSGLLALNWACAIRDRHEVVLGIHRRKVALRGTVCVALDLEDAGALAVNMQRLAPDVVVHTAGLTSVDDCERDPALAHHVNADLAAAVAHAAALSGARLVHISTDHLFAGTRSLYSEDAPPEPLNAYARSKLHAESRVAAASPQALIVRTNFFGWGHRYRRSFSDWVYYELHAGRTLTLFDDVFVTPILADALALTCHRLLEDGATGIYNVTGDERISKYDFGDALADVFDFPKALLRRGKIAASQLSALRPPDMSLDNARTRARLGTSLGNLADHLRTLRQQDSDGRRAELLAAITE